MAPPRSDIPRLTDLDLLLETGRLRLRPFTEGDVDALWPIVSDPVLPRQMTWTAHTDRKATLAFIRETHAWLEDGTALTLAIEHAGVAIGCISLDAIRWQLGALRVDRAELGYWLAPALWGQGFVTEAARALVQFGFDIVGLHKLTVGCVESNIGSRRVIEKVGFQLVGRALDDVWREGRWETQVRYELLARDYSDIMTTMPITRISLP